MNFLFYDYISNSYALIFAPIIYKIKYFLQISLDFPNLYENWIHNFNVYDYDRHDYTQKKFSQVSTDETCRSASLSLYLNLC